MTLKPNKWLRAVSAILAAALLVVAGPARSTETYTFIHTDMAGSPVAATDINGNVVWTEGYRPYGERTKNLAAAASNRQFFHGKAFDADTGLSYFGARYYDPVVGRFMGVDPQHFGENNLHSFNRYAYGNNNPYKYRDPDGRAGKELVLIAIPVFLIGSAIYATRSAAEQKAIRRALNRAVNAIFNESSEESGSSGDSTGPAAGPSSEGGEGATPKRHGAGFPDRELPRDEHGRPVPESENAHTQLGTRQSRSRPGEKYPQAREFDSNGRPVRDVDFTDHGRPKEHPNPHQHRYDPSTGKRLGTESLE